MDQAPDPPIETCSLEELQHLYHNVEDARSPAAFGELWRRYESLFRCLARRWLDHLRDQIEDVLSEAKIKLLKPTTRQRYVPSLRWTTYASAVLHNIILDIHRKRARLRQVDLEMEEVPEREGPGESDFGPAVEECLQGLPAPLRQMVVGRFLQGQKQGEIARQLGRSDATVSRQLNNALTLLRDCLRGKGLGGV
jgi:RNA polymerase sigma factor (sigma-70 family)